MKNLSKKNTIFGGATAITMALCGTGHATASTSDILFILDGSGSMWGQIEGIAKIETAKKTLTKLMDDVPEGARVGFMTYGTTSKDSCQDVAFLNTLGSERAAIKKSISDLKPLGKTPIQTSLVKGISALSKAEPADVQKSLVLVSDGIETCDGDPCAVATTSQQAGVAMKIHVVGFNVDSEARAQLECIAKNGNGQYFNASDTEGFKDAMQAVVQVAQAEPEPAPEPEPVVEEPAEPTITEFFRDDFDGEELAEHWAIEHANPDNFIVEGGVLTMLSSANHGFAAEEPENLMVYTGDLPAGDWDAEITFTGELTASRNRLTVGLRKDKDNYMAASFDLSPTGSGCGRTYIGLTKTTRGQAEGIGNIYRGNGNYCYATMPAGNEDYQAIIDDHIETPMTVTISKRGRNYTATGAMEGVLSTAGEPLVIETNQFTSLRSPGTLSFTIDRQNDRFGKGSGEALFLIDSVVINQIEE
ncbi:MAG: VWA domain-containing protein [Pseudomonadota bacterium]